MSDLLADELIWLTEDIPALRVAEDHPLTPTVLHHGRRNLPSEGTFGHLQENNDV